MPKRQDKPRARKTAEFDNRDTDLLAEIKENFDFDMDGWRDIREEGQTDMRYVSGDPWDPAEKRQRKENKRPIITADELNQYTNQLINDVRQNPRSIKISPKGYGATDDLAEFRSNRVRAIEYKSHAQEAYITGFEGAAQRGYGFFRVTTEYESARSFNQEIKIKRIPDPDSVLYDIGAREFNCSDADHCYVLEYPSIEKFKRDYPYAEIQNFQGDMRATAPMWIKDKFIQVAEYWKVEKTEETLVQFDLGGELGVTTMLLSELPKGTGIEGGLLIMPPRRGYSEGIKTKLLNKRKTEERSVVQYMTNGVEILEKNEWLGQWIPIVPIFGKEMYVDKGAGSERVLMSLIRLARDPYMLYCFYRSCEAEAVGMVPKTSWVGYEGQFEGHEDEWKNANKTPVPYLQVKMMVDQATQSPLPLPQRQAFDPPIQQLELGADAARRAIQSATGMYNSSVGKQDTNVRSGVAIKELNQQSNEGSFHFIDNFNRALQFGGLIINDLITKIEDTEREVALRKADETHEVVKINTREPYADENGKQHHYPTDKGEYDVMVSVGPSFDSQREEAEEFTEQLAQNQQVFPLIGDLVVKLRQLGPIGDEIAKRLTPPQFADPKDPVQLQAQLQQAQGQLQQAQQELAALHMERAGKQMEMSTRAEVAKLEQATKIIVAMLGKQSKADDQEARLRAEQELAKLGFASDAWSTMAEHAHDVAMAAAQPPPEPQAGQV
jgi:hypothetical protein